MKSEARSACFCSPSLWSCLLIFEANVTFIGGVDIADEWMGNADSPQHWRDNPYEVTGPVVAQMQAIFLANLLKK